MYQVGAYVMLQSPEGDWADCDRFMVVMRERDEDGVSLQSPEGDWADCDSALAIAIATRTPVILWLQSPGGDWADCDSTRSDGSRPPGDAALQSPEGDWADCDRRPVVGSDMAPRGLVAIPRRGLG